MGGKKMWKSLFVGSTAIAIAVTVGARSRAEPAASSPGELAAIAEDAYVYGYPLVTMEMTRRIMTNVATPEGMHAPMGQFVHAREYPTAAFRDVTAPNADTLYSVAWLDLSKEPYVLSIPEMQGRYYLMPMLDGWTNVFQDPGKRTTGTRPQKYAITGPGWNGKLPAGVTQYKSPTNLVWILGRIYCTGTPDDYKKVHAVQDDLALVPLSAYGRSYTPPPGRVDPGVDTKTAVRAQVNQMDAASYFKLMAELMKDNPPAKADAPMVAKLAKIGIVPGEDFDPNKLDPGAQKALATTPKTAQARIQEQVKVAGKLVNGWIVPQKVGIYGTDYLQRAAVTIVGLGANRPEDAIYPLSAASADGQPYTGENRYVVHFPKGQTPPANGFWSLTMYNAQMFFVENPLNKYTVSPRNHLKYNQDGSLDLYVQHESPGKEKEANWLPAPSDRFNLCLRLYWPKESMLKGEWVPPPVEKLPGASVSRPQTPPL